MTGSSYIRSLPHIMLIAGTGRGSGKTTLACAIIEKFSIKFPVIGLKISPHFHTRQENLRKLFGHQNFNIYQETSIISEKDSARMLRSGADQVFYIESKDESIMDSFSKLLQLIDKTLPIICESPALGKYIRPGVFIIVDSRSIRSKKKDILELQVEADMFIETEDTDINRVIKQISYDTKGWYIKN